MRDFITRLSGSRPVRWTGNIIAAVLLITGLIGLPSVPEDLSRWGPIIQAMGDEFDWARELASPIATDAGRWLAVVIGIALLFLINYRADRAPSDGYPVPLEEQSSRVDAADRVEVAVERQWQAGEEGDQSLPAQTAFDATAPDPAVEAVGRAWRNTATVHEPVEWCERHRPRALEGLLAASKAQHFEMCARVPPELAVTRQRSLLDAVRESNFDTFGGPIGIVIESRNDSRPRPVADGVIVDFSWAERGTYDYWAMSVRGEFSLTNLSEDVLGRQGHSMA